MTKWFQKEYKMRLKDLNKQAWYTDTHCGGLFRVFAYCLTL